MICGKTNALENYETSEIISSYVVMSFLHIYISCGAKVLKPMDPG